MGRLRIAYYMETYTNEMGGDARYLSLLMKETIDRDLEMVCLCNSQRLKEYLQSRSGGNGVAFKQVDVRHIAYTGVNLKGQSPVTLFWTKVLRRCYPYFFRLVKLAYLLANIFKLYPTLREVSPSILHINNGGYPGGESNRAAVFAARMASIPVVIMTVHNLAQARETAGVASLEMIVDKLIYRYVDAIIVDSNASLKSLQVDRGFARKKLIRIYCGVKSAEEYPDGSVIAAKRYGLNIDSGNKVVAVIANFQMRKGHRYFMEAAALLKTKVPHVTYLMIGDGETKQATMDLARTLGLLEDTVFAGYRNDLPHLLPFIDVLVLPSISFESFPLVVLSAMAHGIPVVGTDIAGIPEQILHGVTGFVVPRKDARALADALAFLLADAERAKEMGRKGKERFQRMFTLDKMIQEIDVLYRELWRKKVRHRVGN